MSDPMKELVEVGPRGQQGSDLSRCVYVYSRHTEGDLQWIVTPC